MALAAISTQKVSSVPPNCASIVRSDVTIWPGVRLLHRSTPYSSLPEPMRNTSLFPPFRYGRSFDISCQRAFGIRTTRKLHFSLALNLAMICRIIGKSSQFCIRFNFNQCDICTFITSDDFRRILFV